MTLEVSSYFTPEELQQLARETQFVQRESKLDGSTFMNLIVFNSDQLKSQSLNDLSIALRDNYDIEITKQSLHERFNSNALLFLTRALEKLLQQQIQQPSSITHSGAFKRLLIKDSVCFQLDESLAEIYPGSGGKGSSAAMRIQFEYDILSGAINDLSVNPFNTQDAEDSTTTIELTREGDLIIRDLAYMNLSVLEKLNEGKSCFLSRLSYNVTVYEKVHDGYATIDFAKITSYMKAHKLQCLEKQVYLGTQVKLPVRLVIHLLPDEVVAERLRKHQKDCKKKGRTIGKQYIARAHLNLFVTNASEHQISTEHVWPLYRLRWQIELIFKTWKSFCHIDKVKKVKCARLQCYIYAKLILILLAWKVLWKIAEVLWKNAKKPLSLLKGFKTLLRSKVDELRSVFAFKKTPIEIFMHDLYSLSRSNLLLESKGKQPNYLEVIIECI